MRVDDCFPLQRYVFTQTNKSSRANDVSVVMNEPLCLRSRVLVPQGARSPSGGRVEHGKRGLVAAVAIKVGQPFYFMDSRFADRNLHSGCIPPPSPPLVLGRLLEERFLAGIGLYERGCWA